MIKRFFNRWAGAMTFIIAACYVILFSLISILRYNAFDYTDFDLAIFSQVNWNILHGSIQSSILGIPFLGNHLNLIAFIFAPLYALFPSSLTLLLLQTLFIGLAVRPLYLLARDKLDKGSAFVFSALYLLYPALHFVNNYEFHYVVFSIPFLLFMFYYFEKERFAAFCVFMFLVLLCKENMSLAVLFFGLYAFFFTKRGRRWWLLPLASGTIWFIGALKIMPYFNQEIMNFNYLYGNFGRSLPEVILNIIKNPLVAMRYVFAEINLRFLFQLFFPLLFLSFLSPKILLIAAPLFLQQLLSSRMTDHSIYYHYTAKLIPFIFISAIYGMRFMLRSNFLSRHKWLLLAALLTASLMCNIYYGFLPSLPAAFRTRYTMQDMDYVKKDFIKRIPEKSPVVATFEFLPKLAARKGLYSFHHVYIMRYTLSSKEYALPDDVEYALVDFNDSLTFGSFYMPEHYKNLQNFFVDTWHLVAAADNVCLFKKGYETDIVPFRQLAGFSSPARDSTRFIIEDEIALPEYSIEDSAVTTGHTYGLSLVWECLKRTEKDYWIALKITDKDGKTEHMFYHPICYRVYPSYSWKKGDMFKEYIRILVPSKVKAGYVWLKMAVLWCEAAGPQRNIGIWASVKTNASGIFDQEGWINLGRIHID